MTIELILAVLAAALNILRGKIGGAPGAAVDVSAECAKIVQAGLAIHQQEAGKPLDPSLIKPLERL